MRKRAGATEDRLDIRIVEVLSDVTHDMGEAAELEKDGVERHLQEALADAPQFCGEGFRLVRREWPTDIGPVDLMCRDEADGWIAVEIKRVATIDAVEQLTRYLERIRLDPAMRALPRGARRAADQAAGAHARRGARDRLRRGRPRRRARRARAGPRRCSPLSRTASGRRDDRQAVGLAGSRSGGPCPKHATAGSSSASRRSLAWFTGRRR